MQPAAPYLTSTGQRDAPHSVSDGEQRMWAAVILRAISDAVWVDANPTGPGSQKISFWNTIVRRRTANRLRDDAVFWFTMDNPAFREVCSYAGLEPSQVRKWALRAMEANNEERARVAEAASLSLQDLRGACELRAQCEGAAG
jgi:hypothetical protein